MKPKTLYIDIDEEITGIIDKVRSSNESIIALVLPKNAPVFQSLVNLKLLKRAAEAASKKPVLITSNPNVMSIAGVSGMYVAKDLKSKPYIPEVVATNDLDSVNEEAIQVDNERVIESLADDQAKNEVTNKSRNNSKVQKQANKPAEAPAESAPVAAKSPKVKSAKSNIKVPNFNRFRKGLIFGILALILLAGFGYWAIAIAPKAKITIKGDTQVKSIDTVVIADTSATALDEKNKVVPATQKETKKTEVVKVPTTGEVNKGNKASGKVTLRNCTKSDNSITLPAGTGVSSSNLTYITQENVTLDPSQFSGGGTCKSATSDVSVIAQKSGEQYNIDKANYTVAGSPGISASGSAMSGGTNQIVKVVTANDIQTAKSKVGDKKAASSEELKAMLIAAGYIPVLESIETTASPAEPSPGIDTEAAEVSVSQTITYTMIGMKNDELHKLISNKAVSEAGIDTSKLVILDDGLAKATYNIGNRNGSRTEVKLKTTVVAGPDINQDEIKKLVAGQKRGKAEQAIRSRPSIKDVRIDTEPFWNFTVPKDQKKITVMFEGS